MGLCGLWGLCKVCRWWCTEVAVHDRGERYVQPGAYYRDADEICIYVQFLRCDYAVVSGEAEEAADGAQV